MTLTHLHPYRTRNDTISSLLLDGIMDMKCEINAVNVCVPFIQCADVQMILLYYITILYV